MKKQFILFLSALILSSCSSNISSSESSISSTDDTLDSSTSFSDEENELLETDKEKRRIELSLKEGTIEEDFAGKEAYRVVIHSLLKQDTSLYNLAVSTSEFGASFLGIPYTINMKMATYVTPSQSFTEGLVDGGIVIKKALRNYDNYTSTNIVYTGSTPEEYSEDNKESYDYDAFLEKFGKLFHGTYYVVEEGEKETFLTDNKSVFLESDNPYKKEKTSSTLFDIDDHTITSGSIIEKEDKTFEVTLSLDNDKGNRYYKKLFTKVAGLYDELYTHGCDLTFKLDKDLNLISSSYSTILDVPVLIFDEVQYFNDVEQTMDTYYYRSSSSTFTVGDNSYDVMIPSASESEFTGYKLLPPKK